MSQGVDVGKPGSHLSVMISPSFILLALLPALVFWMSPRLAITMLLASDSQK